MCSLQCVVEASLGQCWVMEGEDMVPKVSNLVDGNAHAPSCGPTMLAHTM